jgi:hypothetical protein
MSGPMAAALASSAPSPAHVAAFSIGYLYEWGLLDSIEDRDSEGSQTSLSSLKQASLWYQRAFSNNKMLNFLSQRWLAVHSWWNTLTGKQKPIAEGKESLMRPRSAQGSKSGKLISDNRNGAESDTYTDSGFGAIFAKFADQRVRLLLTLLAVLPVLMGIRRRARA